MSNPNEKRVVVREITTAVSKKKDWLFGTHILKEKVNGTITRVAKDNDATTFIPSSAFSIEEWDNIQKNGVEVCQADDLLQ